MKYNKRTASLLMYCIYICAFLLLSAFLLWKCRYGYSNMDESFYLVIPYRFWQGDAMYFDEWHLSQTASFLLMPIIYTYLWFTKADTTGILLNFRYIYTVIWIMESCLIFLALKKTSRIGAVLASFAFLLFSVGGIMALSYNSMGILSLLNACLLLYESNGSRGKLFFSGIFLAAAVLCCPYLASLYFIYCFFLFYKKRKQKNTNSIGTAGLFHSWVYPSAGVLTMAVVFCVFVFSRTSIKEVASSLQYILNDLEHPPMTLLEKAEIYVNALFFSNSVAPYAIIGTLVLAIVGRRFPRSKAYVFVGACILTAAYQIPFAWKMNNINYNILPLPLLGLFSVCVTKSNTVKKLFRCIYFPGLCYTFCINLSSNTKLYSISAVSIIMLVASMSMIAIAAQEVFEETEIKPLKACIPLLCIILFASQLGSELLLRYSTVLWEETSMKGQVVSSVEGPQAGILMTEERLNQYELLLRETEEIRNDESRSVLFFSSYNWLYLCGKNRADTFSAWMAGLPDYNRREALMSTLDEYYRIHGDLPETVFVEGNWNDVNEWLLAKANYKGTLTDSGYWIYQR